MPSRSKINCATWIEVKTLFLYAIMQAMMNPSIPDEFINSLNTKVATKVAINHDCHIFKTFNSKTKAPNL